MQKAASNNISKTTKEVILITGGAGFIGSNYLNYFVPRKKNTLFVNVDCLTYAGKIQNISVIGASNYVFEKVDIRNEKNLERVFNTYKPNGVIHFAAESHVDLSIKNPKVFIETNIQGTNNLLYLSKKYGLKRFMQISTDEVYGSSGRSGRAFREKDKLFPSNPYSASKAAAEYLALSYLKTFGLDIVISRSSNNFGANQDSTKVIPLFITNLLSDKKVPLYGKGEERRNWLYVEDNVRAVELIFRRGKKGEIYNIGSDFEISNFELAKDLVKICGKDESYINFVANRPGHDFCYALDSSKLKKELGWKPKISFEDGIKKTLSFYKKQGN